MAGKSGIHSLIGENKAKEIEKLVKKDRRCLTELNEDGQPPLVAAVDQGRTSLAELLARLGADVNGADTRGWNALHVACLNADLPSATLLLSLGASPNAATRDSQTTPLHYIVRHPHSKELESVMEMMFERKANTELKNGHGETALHYAVMRCNEPVVRILLRHAADVNACNAMGETPLHKAARLGGPATAIVRLLVASGASRTMQSRHGMAYQLVDAQYAELRSLLNPDASPSPASASPSSVSSNPRSLSPSTSSAAVALSSPPQQPPPVSADLSEVCSVGGTVMRTGPDGHQMMLPAAAASAMPTPSPQPLPSARVGHSADGPAAPPADEDAHALELEEGVAPVISPAIGFRLESGKHNALTNVELNLYDYTDHYRSIFAGKKQLHYVGYLTADESDPTVISVLLQSETGKYPEPVHRGIVRTKSSGQDLFFIPASDVAAIRSSRTAKSEKDEREVFAQKLQTHLQDTFFMGCRLWLVEDTKEKKDANNLIEQDLLDFERTDPERSNCFAFGVVYAKEGQSSCKEYWENEHGSPGFDRFLSLLGERITLKGWSKFRGGMDVANDSKGKESVYTNFESKFEVMFHVSTLLPFHPLDPLKLVRARQIQNDVVVLIYQEGNTTYNPETMPTNVAHVFAIVRPFTDPHTGETKYRLGVCSKKNVNSFRPDLPFPPVFGHDARFRHFLLTKLINGQIAARKSGLQMMFTRPRAAMLDEIVKSYRPADKVKKAGSFFGSNKTSDAKADP